LQQAIGCYEAALRVYTEQDYPYDWAMAQNNLGLAYAALPDGDRSAQLQRAMDGYAAALRVYTEQDSPAKWAMIQCNLGVAYQSLPAGDKGENLAKAAACYEAALRVYTEPNYPYECAMTRSNLALARKEQGDFAGTRQALLLAAQAYRLIGMEEGVREVEEELAGLPES
jgi:tetratricopeptide (TPR) repeat protein